MMAAGAKMLDAFFHSLTLAGPGGHAIVFVILALLGVGVFANLTICARYRSIEKDVREETDPSGRFRHRVLDLIFYDAREALARNPRDLNTQAIIERHFQDRLSGLLLGERFCKSLVGLMIILGLVGTFYGLTLSIGKLVTLVSGDAAGVTDITTSITQGLAQALAGMSVAFTSSLFGIGAAIVMTLVGVFFNVADRRAAAMVKIEHYIDNILRPQIEAPDAAPGYAGTVNVSPKLEQIVQSFGHSVAKLEAMVTHFDSALQGFAATTRDFREFNLHLKDNIQRMSLNFGDFSETLKTQVVVLKSRDPR
jgi:MotA/TolQ/ExbB proton channel family